MVHKQHIIVIGGGYAGLMAALRLKNRLSRQAAQITLVNGSDTFVERIRLHQVASGQALKQHSIPALLRGTGVEFEQGFVTAIQPYQKTIQVGERTLRYDKLMYAAGSTIKVDSVPGVREYTYSLGDKAAAENLQANLSMLNERGGRIVIVGGGLTGIESATELAENYPNLRVTMATGGEVGESLSVKARDHVRQAFDRLGVTLRDHIQVESVTEKALHLVGGETIEFDVCLWAGSFSVSPLARESGLAVNKKGQVIIDPYMRSASHPDVYAVGDAAIPEVNIHPQIRMSCQAAMPMAVHGAENLSAAIKGRDEQPFSFRFSAQCVSLGRRDGVVQMVNPDDEPTGHVFTGKLGAFIKEQVCRYTLTSIKLERWLPFYYIPRYPQQKLETVAES